MVEDGTDTTDPITESSDLRDRLRRFRRRARETGEEDAEIDER
jgi:hypothetical protein